VTTLDLGGVRETLERDGGVEIVLERGRAFFDAPSEHVLRMRATQYGALQPYRSYAVERPEATARLALSRSGGRLLLATRAASLAIDLDECAVSLLDGRGGPLSRGFALGARDGAIIDRREAPAGEDYFGLGERLSPLGRRGYTVENWNWDDPNHHNETTRRMYSSLPFMIGCGGPRGPWGCFVDSSYRTIFDVASTRADQIAISVDRGDLVIYFFTGDGVPDLVERYTALTGRHALPPLWALGHHQCRYSYMSAAEAAEVAQEFRSRSIPCDAIWYDIDYMHDYRVFTFDPVRFPDPAKHIRAQKEKGFRTVVIVDPGVKVDPPGTYPVLDEGTARGFFVRTVEGRDFEGPVWPGGTKFPDFSRPDVRKWWGALHRVYVEAGIDGFWNDMNEPAVLDERKTLPEGARMCDDGWWSTMDRMHNVYGLFEAMATVEGIKRLRPGERVFLLTRAAYAGIQRWSAKWTGDNTSTWAHLKDGIAQVLNLGLSGVGFAGVDVGGFGDNATGELLARWYQAASLFAFYRNHSCKGTVRQEPWAFGPQIERVCREAITLRYRYLPALYQLFHEMARTGAPVARPLFWHYPEARALAVADQYLAGPSLLVAPVVERGAVERLVWLPPGTWYEHTAGLAGARGAAMHGGRTIVAAAPLDRLPLYVRAGSLLAAADPVESTAALDRTRMVLEVWPGGAAAVDGVLYEDDGASEPVTPLVHRWRLEPSGRLEIDLAEATRLREVVVRTVDPQTGVMSEQRLGGRRIVTG
jgi:alpha-glucosidase